MPNDDAMTAEEMLAEMVRDTRGDLQLYTRARVRAAITIANQRMELRAPGSCPDLLALALIQLAEGQAR